MDMDEAIERNKNIQMEFLPLPRHRDWEAVQLGIEALKRVKDNPIVPTFHLRALLPGETEK